MSHLIIREIDTLYTPEGEYAKTWHGLETVVKGGIAIDGGNCPEVFCPIVQCGMKPDYTAEVSNVPADLAEDGAVSFADWKLILADCRKGKSGKVWPLHVPRKGYAIHDNRTLFDCMIKSATEVLGANGFEIVTLGTLGGYTQFIVSLAIKSSEGFKIGKGKNGDAWKQFYQMNSSHNGLVASTRNISLVRMVCMNTVQAAIAQATEQDTLTVIKHSANSMERLTPQVFAEDLTKWLKASESFRLVLEGLKGQSMDLPKFKAFAAGVFTQEGSDKLSTTSYNRVEELGTLFVRGIGNEGKTAYDAVNAFTEYFTHGAGVGSDRVSKAKRIASANFGRGNDWKREALRVLSDETEYADTVKRGERFYADKLAEMTAKN